MKRLFSKRWHHLPVGIITAVLLVCLVAGGAVAAAGYGFFNATIVTTVEEAIYPSYGWDDDLSPYMIPDGAVLPRITASPEKFRAETGFSATFTIGPKQEGDPDASEFVAGDQLVLPLNLRNRGDAPLTVACSYTASPGLTLEYAFETNTTGAGYKAAGSWGPLNGWSQVLPPHGGSFGSAQVGATVLFVKVTAAGNAAPGSYTLTFTLTRE